MHDQMHPPHHDPETHSGAPVFTGTRIPVKVLFDYLADAIDRCLRAALPLGIARTSRGGAGGSGAVLEVSG